MGKSIKRKEFQNVKQILTVALDLCERNSSQNTSDQNSSQLWFNILDRLINAKNFLRLKKELPEHARLVSDFLRELLQITMQRMLSNVSLQDLLCKITMDHHDVDTALNSPSNLRPPLTNNACKLGEYREMISSMLQTYRIEQSLLQAASNVMHSDLRQISLKKYGLKLNATKVNTSIGVNDQSNFHSSVNVSSNGNINATYALPNSSYSQDERHSSRKDAHLTSLEKKRLKRNTNVQRGYLRVKRNYFSLSTLKDQNFGKGNDDSFCSHRVVGALSNAEHFGRFG